MAEEVLLKRERQTQGSLLTKEERNPDAVELKDSKCLILTVLTTLLGSCLPAGYNLGVINTPQEIIRIWMRTAILETHQKDLSEGEEILLWSAVVSIFVVGATVGSSFGIQIADRIGRRPAMLVNHLLCFCSAFLLLWCRAFGSVEMLVLGRILTGLYTGFATCLVPLYLSEIAPIRLKGVMAILFPLGINMGILTSQVMGMERILELHRLHGSNAKYIEVQADSLRILAKCRSAGKREKNPWGLGRVLKSPGYRLSLIIGVVFNAGQQFSGINAVFYYSTLIFRTAGLDVLQSQAASIGAGVVNCVLALLAVPIIRYCRRRVILLTSVALSVLCQGVLLLALRFVAASAHAPYVAIAALVSYVLAFGIGLGPVPFMIATELLPVGPRSLGISLGGASNWLSNLIVGITFPLLQEVLGELSFLSFIVSSSLFFVFVYRFLPETLGKEVMSLPHLSKEARENPEGVSSSTEVDSNTSA